MTKALEKSIRSPPEELTQEDLERLRKKLEKSKQQMKRTPRKRKENRSSPSKPKKKKKLSTTPPPKERSPSPPPMEPLIRYEYEPMENYYNAAIMVPEISYEVEISGEPLYEQQFKHYIYYPY